jgi:hypothetical protein
VVCNKIEIRLGNATCCISTWNLLVEKMSLDADAFGEIACSDSSRVQRLNFG